jgi:hypothetical protein
MPVTGVRGRQILDGDVFRSDLNVTSSTQAVAARIIAGTNISIASTNANMTGTGDVTINATGLLPLTGGTLTGNLGFSNATSPFTGFIQFGDNTGWVFRFMTNVSGTPTERFRFVDNGNFQAVGQIATTRANSTADGTGQIYLNGATGNRIDFNLNGVAAPSLTTRSVGTKIVLYPSVTASQVDYAFGIESDTLWSSVAVAGGSFKWYGGTQLNMRLEGAELKLTGNYWSNGQQVLGSDGTSNYLQTAATLYFNSGVTNLMKLTNTGNVTIGNISDVARLTIRGAAAGTSLYLTDTTNSTLYITHNAGGRTSFFNGTATQWMHETGGSVTIGNSTSAPSKLFLFNTNDSIPDYQITHQSAGTTNPTSSPIIISNLWNNGSNGHNLYITSSSATGSLEYNITKTWDGIITLGVSNVGTSVVRQVYLYSSGQLRFANYTATNSFTGTLVGYLGFTSDGSIITTAAPSGSTQWVTSGSNIYYSAGNVSIGTATSDARLRVSGSSNSTQAIFSQVDGRGLEIATSLQAGTNDAGSVLNARGAGSGTLIIQTDGVEQARFLRNGDIGFGTATPTNTANYRSLQIQGGSVGGLIRFSDSTGTNRGTIYGSTAETAINSVAQFNLYVDNTNIVNASTTTIDVLSANGFAIGNKAGRRRIQYDAGVFSFLNDANGGANLIGATFNPSAAGAQLRISGGGTEAGISVGSGSNLLNITDFSTNSRGLIIDLSTGVTFLRSSLVDGSYFQFQRNTSTNYGYIGNSANIFSTAGFTSNTDLGIRSEGAINFGTGATGLMRILTSGQLRLTQYTATTSFTGTAVGVLAFTSDGSIITIATPSGGGGSSQWTTDGTAIYYNTGNVGIGATTPLQPLHILEPSGTAAMVRLEQTSQRTYEIGSLASSTAFTIRDVSATANRFQVLSTGQLVFNSYTAINSFTFSSLQGNLGFNSSGNIVTTPTAFFHITFLAAGNLILNNMASALQFFNNQTAYITRADLNQYKRVRLHVMKGGTAGASGSRIILRYRRVSSGFSTTTTDYSDFTSECSVLINLTNSFITSSWITLPTNAQEDVFLALMQQNGDGSADPVIGGVYAEFDYRI